VKVNIQSLTLGRLAAVSTTHRKVRQGKYPIASVVDSLLIHLTAKRRRK